MYEERASTSRSAAESGVPGPAAHAVAAVPAVADAAGLGDGVALGGTFIVATCAQFECLEPIKHP